MVTINGFWRVRKNKENLLVKAEESELEAAWKANQIEEYQMITAYELKDIIKEDDGK